MRFPGFDGEWIEKKLGGIAEKVNSGKTPLGGEAVYTDEGVLFIRSQNVNNDKLDLANSAYIPEAVNEGMKNSVVLPNDILLNITGASLGRSCVVPGDFTVGNVNQHVCIIRLGKEYNPRFIQPILSSIRGQNTLMSLQTGSGREGLNFESIRRIKVFIPNQAEQNKIASFLAIIQDRIDTQNKIIEKYKTLIQHIREKVFWDDKKQCPPLRFLDYKNDWRQIRLSQIVSRVTRRNKNNATSLPLTIAAQHGLVDQTKFFNKQIASKDMSNYYLLLKGEFAYNKSYSKGYPWGAVKRLDSYDMGALSGLYFCFRPNEEVNSDYLAHYFETSKWHKGISEISGEGARNHGLLNISVDNYFNTVHVIPERAEQDKIATFLNLISNKLTVEQDLLKCYQLQKAYLVEQLFI